MGNFVHLHLHSEYSLLDGAARIKKVVKVAKEYGMPAIAITDHGNMYGAVKMFDACEEAGIKAIIGCEFYVANDLHVKNGKAKFSHLVLLAKDEVGYKNLCKLNAIAFVEGFYYKPRIDYKTLEKYHEGLICLSACLAGDIPQLILKRQFDEAEKMVLWFKDLFGDDFYLEMQNHGLAEDFEVNDKLREYSKKFGIKTVATNDVHYIFKDDAEMHDVLLCVQMGKTKDDPDRLKFPCDEFYFKTYEEMQKAFPNDPEALEATMEIADKCNFEFQYGHYLYPSYQPADGSEPSEYLRRLVMEGLEKKYDKITPEILERFESEYKVISTQGYIEYFLIVWDYINAARKMGISVGPGRGSGAGSLIAYAIGITNIDPLKFDLLFERFLHSERVSAPDFDVDFEDVRRQEVIDYVREKYGDDRVVKIVTFGTMAAKNAIKDVGRVLKVPYKELDAVTKAIPNNVKKPQVIAKCFGLYKPKEGDNNQYGVPELIEMYNNNDDIKRVVDIAIKCEDSPRQTGIHACGVVIGADILDRHMPLSRNGEDVTTQYNMIEIEHLGHLKMDFLGLRNLTDVKLAQQYVKENHGVEIDFDKCTYDDPNVFKLISTGNTKGIFQIESPGFQKFMRELQPTCIEDIIAAVSLYRPGPMDSIPRYVHNKHHPEDTCYDHPCLEPILNVTYGCIVYQEQVMKVVQEMAGYTLGQADMVRRIMGKKQADKMPAEKKKFLYGAPEVVDKHGHVSPAIDGAIKRGVPEDVALKVWGEMESFASYAFNKSHAAAYSLITYQTAYLKTYYKPEFLTALLNNRITSADEIKNYVTYAKSEKIDVLPPDINKSQTYFSVKDGKIRFGLAALKNVGIGVVDGIIEERNLNGAFKDLDDFISRIDTQAHNKRCIESMILSGAFDSFGVKRSQMMQVYASIIDRVSAERKKQSTGQFSLFDALGEVDESKSVTYPNIPEYDQATRLKLEKEVVGVYISGHPLSGYEDKFKNYNLTGDMLQVDLDAEVMGAEITDEAQTEAVYDGLSDGMSVTCGGIITEMKKMLNKSNKEMAFGTVEDLYGSIEFMVFPNAFAKCKPALIVDNLVEIKGRLSIREGKTPSVVVDSITPWDLTKSEQEVEQLKPKTLYLKYNLTDIETHNKIFAILRSYPGVSPVIVKCSVENKSFKLNVNVDTNSFLLNELHAYIPDQFIRVM